MAAFTLTTLRTLVRERADMPVAGFVADSATSLDKWINDAIKKLHWKLITAMGEDYSLTESSFSTVAGTSDYTAAGILRLYGVEMSIGGERRTLHPYSRNERNGLRNSLYVASEIIPRYRLIQGGISNSSNDTKIRLLPVPQAGGTVYYSYAGEITPLSSGSDTIYIPGGWEKYVVLDAAIQCLIKEESDTRALEKQLQQMDGELELMKEQRDASMAQQVVDMDVVDRYTIF